MKAISILTKILATFVMLGCFSLPAFAANAMHIVINNHLGAPEMLIDENRHVVWQAEYDEFGKATILVEEVEFNHRLPGQYYDKETGLHYNYYRDYDPSLGRYVQSDPIGLAGGINTYAYALGNPNKYTDFYGLDVSVCRAPAFYDWAPVDHTWLSTDTQSAGMGGDGRGSLGTGATITDHSDKQLDDDVSCEVVSKDDEFEKCVNTMIEVTLDEEFGHWFPPFNYCGTYTDWVLEYCEKEYGK